MYIVPVEEVWAPNTKGEEIAVGYMNIRIEPNEIKVVRQISEGIFQIELKDDILISFPGPTEKLLIKDALREIPQDVDNVNRQKLAEIAVKSDSFESPSN